MCSHQRGHYFLRPHLPTAGVGGEREKERQTDRDRDREGERERKRDRQTKTDKEREREAGYCKVHQVLDLEIKSLEVMSLRNQFAP